MPHELSIPDRKETEKAYTQDKRGEVVGTEEKALPPTFLVVLALCDLAAAAADLGASELIHDVQYRRCILAIGRYDNGTNRYRAEIDVVVTLLRHAGVVECSSSSPCHPIASALTQSLGIGQGCR